jgi:hypothetical protein
MEAQKEKLFKAATQASEILYKAETVFPFTLFPDNVTIDREKLNISYRAFFKVAKVISTPLDDIESVDANTGPFFGSLRITSRFFVNNTRYVKFLQRDDAIKIQSILQGYKLAKEKDIDMSEINKDELVMMLCKLGEEPKDY